MCSVCRNETSVNTVADIFKLHKCKFVPGGVSFLADVVHTPPCEGTHRNTPVKPLHTQAHEGEGRQGWYCGMVEYVYGSSM